MHIAWIVVAMELHSQNTRNGKMQLLIRLSEKCICLIRVLPLSRVPSNLGRSPSLENQLSFNVLCDVVEALDSCVFYYSIYDLFYNYARYED